MQLLREQEKKFVDRKIEGANLFYSNHEPEDASRGLAMSALPANLFPITIGSTSLKTLAGPILETSLELFFIGILIFDLY